MARMKDIKIKCENKFNIIKEKLRIDKGGDHSLKLPYDTTQASSNISVAKEFCSEIRRIGSYGLATYSIIDEEKKMSKKSLSGLAGIFNETSSKFSETDPKRGPLNFNALALMEINKITSEFRKLLESQVMIPLNNLEGLCVEIQELEKKLHSLKRDISNLMDKQTRFDEQTTQDEQKSLQLKDQIENSQTEYENLSELYINKVLLFESTNFQHAEALQDMLILRTEYHEKCAKTLMNIIPQCNTYIEDKRVPLSFGTPLENHLRDTKRLIAYPIEFCVKTLSDIHNLQQEGLFRVSGSINKANLLCSILNLMKSDQVDIDWPPHVVADALKRYLREMPVSLLGKVSYAEWDSCFELSKCGKKQAAYKKIKEILGKLPKSYYQNIEYLIRFLNLVVREKSHNLMGIPNICMVFVPNLFKVALGDSMNIDNNTSFNFVLESLLTDTNFFFTHSDQLDKEESKIRRSSGPDKSKPNISTNIYDRQRVSSRSQRRREQLQVSPLNLEELENVLDQELSASLSFKFESDLNNPPVPPRLKVREK